ncbi:LPXTG cell wall anchor domain-containing protein, partial [Finegoldia magna]|uniref:LPXTG cell wall anchor domain-containing protein n=1 Tax=Finegoldia magna TaxID=1260 RepID=UPI0007992A0C
PGKENPANPGTPGKTPEENGKTPENNGKTPENKGKTPENNGKTPENNGKTPDNSREDSPNKPNETPKTPETTEQVEGKEKADTPNRKSANKLPKAGSESEIMMLSMSALTTAAGFIGLKKKRKDR